MFTYKKEKKNDDKIKKYRENKQKKMFFKLKKIYIY